MGKQSRTRRARHHRHDAMIEALKREAMIKELGRPEPKPDSGAPAWVYLLPAKYDKDPKDEPET